MTTRNNATMMETILYLWLGFFIAVAGIAVFASGDIYEIIQMIK